MARGKWSAFQLVEWIQFEPGRSITERRAVSRCFGYPWVLGIPVPKTQVFSGVTQKTTSKLNRRLGQVTWHQYLICRGPKIIASSCHGDSDQSAVSSENLYFSIGFNQLSDLSKVCLSSVRVWEEFSYNFGDPNNVCRNLLRVRVSILAAVNVWDIGYVWTTYYIQTIEVQRKSRGLLPVGIGSKHTYTLASFWEK